MWIVEMFRNHQNCGKISFENKGEAEDFMDFQGTQGILCQLDYQERTGNSDFENYYSENIAENEHI